MSAPVQIENPSVHERLVPEELRTLREVESLSEEWHALWLRSGGTPFQSPMWLLPWFAQFTGNNLRVLVWRKDAELVAVAPFYTWSEGADVKLFLAGNGISDYLDVTLDPLFEPDFSRAFGERLAASPDVDACEFNQLPEDSPLLQLNVPAQAGAPCPVLDLRGKSELDYSPARQLEKLRYYRRRAAKFGQWEIQQADCGKVLEVMHHLFRLHALRWSTRGEQGVLREEQSQAFHRQAAQNFARAGNLRLYSLELNKQIVGVLYAFANARATYYYLSGFDPEFEKISPGTLLIGHAIERAIAESHCDFNFLRGAEPYKYAWGATDRQTHRLTVKPAAARR
jgi:CelD/BcsL family acetyltransferase involved in cellulose biosynthesis